MFDFDDGPGARRLILDPGTGRVVAADRWICAF
jgi:hypothetical protein